MEILNRMPGVIKNYFSVNLADINDDDGAHQLPAEYLQSLSPPGLPPAVLILKKGALIMLLHNLNPKQGLCNGTQLCVPHLSLNCIEGRILGGEFDDQKRLLFQVKLTTSDAKDPFTLTRKQFPIRLCFAVTVNKSQGQSLGTVGVDLRTSCFSHGQLYVAFSRVTDVSWLSVLFDPSNSDQKTDNVVFPEVLLPPSA